MMDAAKVVENLSSIGAAPLDEAQSPASWCRSGATALVNTSWPSAGCAWRSRPSPSCSPTFCESSRWCPRPSRRCGGLSGSRREVLSANAVYQRLSETTRFGSRSNRHNGDVWVLFCIAFLWSSTLSAQPQFRPIDNGWFTVRQPSKWQSPPRQLHSKIKSGPAQIMVLYPSGDFGYLACYLIRRPDGSVTISRGDGFVVKIGNWEKANGTVTVRSRTVYREVVAIGQPIPEPEVMGGISEQGTTMAAGASGLATNGRSHYRVSWTSISWGGHRVR